MLLTDERAVKGARERLVSDPDGGRTASAREASFVSWRFGEAQLHLTTSTTVYSPVPSPRNEGIDPHAPRPGDSPEVAAWRARGATPEAKELYKLRASTIELVSADIKEHRGLRRLAVSGTRKVLTRVLWTVLAYDLLQAIRLGAFT